MGREWSSKKILQKGGEKNVPREKGGGPWWTSEGKARGEEGNPIHGMADFILGQNSLT